MGKERNRTRIKCRVDEFPDEIKELLNNRLNDVNIGYLEISEELTELGYPISKSSIARYASRMNKVSEAIRQFKNQTIDIIEAARDDKNLDVIGAVTSLMSKGLLEKMAVAQEEIIEMPIDKAMRVAVQIERSSIHKEKMKSDRKRKVDLAFEAMEDELMIAINSDPALAKELKLVLKKAQEKMIDDE